MTRVIDESLQHYSEQQQKKTLSNMEFNRRLALEKELDKTDSLQYTELTFDESGNFLLVPTMIGIKVINLVTNRLARLIGKPENMRFLSIALFQVSIHCLLIVRDEKIILACYHLVSGKSKKSGGSCYVRDGSLGKPNTGKRTTRSYTVHYGF